MKRKIHLIAYVLALCAVICACSSDSPPESEKQGRNDRIMQSGSKDSLEDGTQEMIQLLEHVVQRATPKTNPYLNSQRADYFRNVLQSAQPNRKAELRFSVATELLHAGKTEEAIKEYEMTLQMASKHKDKTDIRFLRDIKKQLAVSYMRLGEQENCILNHSAESCIVPISKEGVHQIERGSRAAIKIYLELLDQFPDDLDSGWLLNVAYMTLGEYPHKVPRKWLIPPEVFKSDYRLKRFSDVAPNLGLDVTGLLGGSVMEDFDRDGYLDIMASSWGLKDQLRCFRNNGDGTFSDFTLQAGLKGIVSGINLVHADYNNDGYPDVFVLRGAWFYRYGDHPNSLLRNNGDGTFTDVTRAAGVLSFHPTQTAAWADFNNDGWLDLFVGNESTQEGGAHASELFQNIGGTFINVAQEVGVAVHAYVKGTAWGDYDNDGLSDLYISCLQGPNYFFKNNGADHDGKWSFTNVAEQAGVEEPVHSLPTWFFDYDNDGWLDIFVSGYDFDRLGLFAAYAAAEYLQMKQQVETPRLYRNNGDGTFTNVTKKAGLDKPLFTMGCNFGDLDNDGYLDFYLGTGEPDLRSIIPNRMFRNAGGKTFQDVTTSGGFGHLQKGHGVAFGDLDNDGDQDIYAVMGGSYEGDVFQNVLFENPGTSNHWITLFLEGVKSNKYAIGTRIKVTVQTSKGKRDIYATVSTGGSFGSSSLRQEIGLGNAHAIERIEITWPKTGKKQIFRNVKMDQPVKIVEGRSEMMPHPLAALELAKENQSDHTRHHKN